MTREPSLFIPVREGGRVRPWGGGVAVSQSLLSPIPLFPQPNRSVSNMCHHPARAEWLLPSRGMAWMQGMTGEPAGGAECGSSGFCRTPRTLGSWVDAYLPVLGGPHTAVLESPRATPGWGNSGTRAAGREISLLTYDPSPPSPPSAKSCAYSLPSIYTQHSHMFLFHPCRYFQSPGWTLIWEQSKT